MVDMISAGETRVGFPPHFFLLNFCNHYPPPSIKNTWTQITVIEIVKIDDVQTLQEFSSEWPWTSIRDTTHVDFHSLSNPTWISESCSGFSQKFEIESAAHCHLILFPIPTSALFCSSWSPPTLFLSVTHSLLCDVFVPHFPIYPSTVIFVIDPAWGLFWTSSEHRSECISYQSGIITGEKHYSQQYVLFIV